MKRRQLLSSLAALGLVAATPEPVRRYWRGHTFEPGPLQRAADVWERGEAGMQAYIERRPQLLNTWNIVDPANIMHGVAIIDRISYEFVPYDSDRYAEVFVSFSPADQRVFPKPKVILL